MQEQHLANRCRTAITGTRSCPGETQKYTPKQTDPDIYRQTQAQTACGLLDRQASLGQAQNDMVWYSPDQHGTGGTASVMSVATK